MVDIVIPLGTGSKSNNDELRILLRSIEKNGRGYNQVIIVATEPPDWLRNAEVIKMPDRFKRNKDGNIIEKVLAGARKATAPEIVWTSDDRALLNPVDLDLLPPVWNRRRRSDFPTNGSIWQKRVRRTFEYVRRKNGVKLEHNYESHFPQRYAVAPLLKAMEGVDYSSGRGLSINTLFMGLLGVTGGFDQRLFKTTCEGADWKLTNRLILGYNDTAFLNGLRKELFKRFPHPSRFEK